MDLLTQEIIEAQNAALGHTQDEGIGAVTMALVRGQPTYSTAWFPNGEGLLLHLDNNPEISLAFAVTKVAAKVMRGYYAPVVKRIQL